MELKLLPPNEAFLFEEGHWGVGVGRHNIQEVNKTSSTKLLKSTGFTRSHPRLDEQ